MATGLFNLRREARVEAAAGDAQFANVRGSTISPNGATIPAAAELASAPGSERSRTVTFIPACARRQAIEHR